MWQKKLEEKAKWLRIQKHINVVLVEHNQINTSVKDVQRGGEG